MSATLRRVSISGAASVASGAASGAEGLNVAQLPHLTRIPSRQPAAPTLPAMVGAPAQRCCGFALILTGDLLADSALILVGVYLAFAAAVLVAEWWNRRQP